MSNVFLHSYPIKEVWFKASQRLIEIVSASIEKRKRTLLFLSGGSVVRMYNRLADHLEGKSSLIIFAQVDERFKPEHQDDINAYQIAKTGLWQVCKKRNIPFYTVSQKGTLQSATAKYNQTISKIFRKAPPPRWQAESRVKTREKAMTPRMAEWTPRMVGRQDTYKIAIFGIGPDAHTAGLAPGYKSVWNVNTYVVGYENDGLFKNRITLTPLVIERLDYAIIVAEGEKKRRAISSAMKKGNLKKLNQYPAAIIQRIKKVDLFTDLAI